MNINEDEIVIEASEYVKAGVEKLFQIPRELEKNFVTENVIAEGFLHAIATGQNVVISTPKYDQYRIHMKVKSQFNFQFDKEKDYLLIEDPLTRIEFKRQLEISIIPGNVPDIESKMALKNLENVIIKTLKTSGAEKYVTFEPQMVNKGDDDYTRTTDGEL